MADTTTTCLRFIEQPDDGVGPPDFKMVNISENPIGTIYFCAEHCEYRATFFGFRSLTHEQLAKVAEFVKKLNSKPDAA